MSKKRKIIIFGIIAVLAVGLILFSTVFRVRHQNVSFTAEIDGVTAEDIIDAGEIKGGKSVFLINKQEVKNKIEKAVPYAKVENVFVTFPSSLNFEISKREEFCYFESGEQFMVCDSSLKILRTSMERPELIKIEAEIDENLAAGDFIDISDIKIMFDCFAETISIELDGENSPEFTLNREKAINTIESVVYDKNSRIFTVKAAEGFSVEYSANNVLDKHYYLMGILVNENSSILTAENRASGKTFVLENTSNGMRKYAKNEI